MLNVAIPDFDTYNPKTGIGRVVYGLVNALGRRITPYSVSARKIAFPVLRNFPYGVRGAPPNTDVVLFPKLVGTSALHTGFPYKSVVMCHDVGTIENEKDLREFNAFSKYLIRRDLAHLIHANHIMVPSNFTKTRLLAHMPYLGPKITVANVGVSDDYFTSQIDKQSAKRSIQDLLKLKISGPTLLYVGNENPRKNFGFLLQVLCQLKTNHPGIVLLKVGAAGYEANRRETLRQAERLGLVPGQDFILIDSLEDDALIRAYRAADVVVSGSLYEGFGLPYIESLALGVPVVAIKTGILEDGLPGVYISEHDVTEFASKVNFLLQNNVVDYELVRNFIRERYSWNRYADKFLSMLQET